MKKIILPITLIVSLTGVYFLTNSFNENTTHFYGIADNQEQSVSFQESVEVLSVNVIEGQYVDAGTVLLRAKRNHLNVQKNQLKTQIEALDARQNEANVSVDAEVSVLRAQERTELAKIDIQITELQSKLRLNHELFQNIVGSSPRETLVNPLRSRILSLQRQRQILKEATKTKISSLLTKEKAADKPISIQKKQIVENLDEINRQEAELTIKAEFSGRIGNINYKKGEQVAAFQPILTVYGLYPKMIKGYIHENVSNDVKIGQQVWIHPFGSSKRDIVIEGMVESLGSRIIEYPERLKKNPMVKSWGREVNIRLPMNNTLLLGEKVQVSFSPQRPNSVEAFFKPFGEKTKTLFPKAYVGQNK